MGNATVSGANVPVATCSAASLMATRVSESGLNHNSAAPSPSIPLSQSTCQSSIAASSSYLGSAGGHC